MAKIKTELVIISILWLSVILSLYLTLNYDVCFLFGIIGLSIVTVTYTKYNDFSLALLFFILFFSMFDVIKFSYAFGAHFSIINIGSFLLFTVLFFRKFDKILELKAKFIDSESEEINIKIVSKLEFFKTQFKEMSLEELERKLNTDHLTNEAKQAVIELIEAKRID